MKATRPADPPQRLLVVEDDKCICYVLQAILHNAGFDVTLAHNGRQGWELLKKQDFDLILMDLGMPELSGEELCALVRDDSRNDSTPIVLVTSRVFEIDAEHFQKRYGIAALFGKPFSCRKLLTAIHSILTDRGAEQAISAW